MMSTDALKELSCGPLWLLLNGSDILSIDADLIAVTKKNGWRHRDRGLGVEAANST